MGLESPTHIDDLVPANPVGSTDAMSTVDDHIRNLKTVLQTDFPDVDAATASYFVSATAPTSPVAGTRWHDTTLDVLKIRDKANTAWITQAGSVVTNNSVDINAGTIDGATIGATTPAAADFTTMDTTGNASVGGTLTVTGNILPTALVDGRDVAADGTKLDGIEAGADANIALASQAEAEAGTENTKTMTALRTAQAIDGYGGRPIVFTGNGTYQVPDGVTLVLVKAQGGGGGGSGAQVNSRAGAGGGSGSYTEAVITVTPGGTEAVVVGAGGAGGAAGNNVGSSGGDSTVGSTKVVAKAGSGAGLTTGGAGGAAGTTTGTEMNTDTGYAGADSSGISAWGAGGVVRNGNNTPGGGGDGVTKGGGGSGDNSSGASRPGGDGADGYIIIIPLI